MNTQVSATNMQVRAVAEKGLLINEVSAANSQTWDESATAAQSSSKLSTLYPASTTNGTAWYHAASEKSNLAASATSGTISPLLINDEYETLSDLVAIATMTEDTASDGTQAKFETMGKEGVTEAGYYVHYEYYLKSAGAAIDKTATYGVIIKSVTASITANATGETPANSADLDKAIRVGIKLNSDFYIYAPVSGFTPSYYVNASSTATTAKAGTVATLTDLATLPAANAAGAKVDVYIWYEGEDANCTSDNAMASTLDDIKIDIVFALDSFAEITGNITENTETANLGTETNKTFYKVGTTTYYADTATYTAGTTKFYTISDTDPKVATPVGGTIVYTPGT